jgi:membrane protein DedA with SNARE-associated domain
MHIVHAVTAWVLHLILQLGYFGLAAGMFGQAVGVPLPSEVMMSFSGYLAWSARFTLPLVIIAGTAGDTLGALVAYAIGYYGGRPLLVHFGRMLFFRQHELERADRWFAEYGARTALICKLLPGIRAVASYPAGATRLPLGLFLGYTFIGSVIWCTAFAYIGYVLGRHWYALNHYLRPISIVLLALILVGVVAWIWLHFRAESGGPQTAEIGKG